MALWRKILSGVAFGAAASQGAGLIGRAVTAKPTRYLRIGDRRVALYEKGAGPAVFMIHGLGGQSCNFYKLFDRLTDFRRLAMDRPGAGWSDHAPRGGSDLAGHAATAAEAIEKSGAGKVVLVGHSLGGAIALKLALERPDLVAGLVVIAGLTGQQLPRLAGSAARFGRRPVLREISSYILAAPLTPVLGPYFGHASFYPDPVPPEFLTRGGALMSLQPKAISAVWRDLEIVAKDSLQLREDLHRISVPTTVIHGTQDRVLPYRTHAVAAARAIPDSTLLLTDGGHMLPMTHADLVAEAIRRLAAL